MWEAEILKSFSSYNEYSYVTRYKLIYHRKHHPDIHFNISRLVLFILLPSPTLRESGSPRNTYKSCASKGNIYGHYVPAHAYSYVLARSGVGLMSYGVLKTRRLYRAARAHLLSA